MKRKKNPASFPLAEKLARQYLDGDDDAGPVLGDVLEELGRKEQASQFGPSTVYAGPPSLLKLELRKAAARQYVGRIERGDTERWDRVLRDRHEHRAKPNPGAKALDKKALWKSIDADERAKRRKKLAELQGAARAATKAKRARMLEVSAHCRAARDRAKLLGQVAKDAKQRAAAARGQAKHACSPPDLAELRTKIAAARIAYREEHSAIKALRASERRYKSRAIGAAKEKAREARGESDDEVTSNLPPDLIPLWSSVRRSIKATPRMSRTEAFLKYAEEHPREVYASADDAVDDMIAQHERELRGNPAELVAVDPSKATAKNTHVLGRLTLVQWGGRATSSPRNRSFSASRGPLLGYHACGDRKCPEEGKLIVVYAPSSRPGAPSAEYRRTHWGEAPAKHFVGTATRIASLRELGPLRRVVYTTRKGGDPAGELVDYDHAFEGTLPILLEHACHEPKCAEVGQLVIAGGTYRVTDRGIVG